MFIDCHGQVSAPAALWAYKSWIPTEFSRRRGTSVRGCDDDIIAALNAMEIGQL